MGSDDNGLFDDLVSASESDILPDVAGSEPYRAAILGTWKDDREYRALLDVEPEPDEDEAYDEDEDAETWAVVLHRTADDFGEDDNEAPRIIRFDNRHSDEKKAHADKLWLRSLGQEELKEWKSDRPKSERED